MAEDDDWIKVDLHIHTLDDPKDALDYSAHELLERARALGFRVLAITLHDAVFDRAEVFADAASMGILLIPAAEVRLEGADVILLNVRANEIESLRTLGDLEKLRAARGPSLFTIAPHPFYPGRTGLHERLEREIDLFDAIEWSHFWSRRFDRWNRRAAEVARRARKPLIGTSDVHRLDQLGLTYTLVDALDRSPEGILRAVRAGRTHVITKPLSEVRLAWILGRIVLGNRLGRRVRPESEPAPALGALTRTRPQASLQM